jgi:hypothetical protein
MSKHRQSTKGRTDSRQAVRDLLATESLEALPARAKDKRFQYKHHHDWEVDGVKVSDHAVLRYLQHVKGVDVKTIREELLAEGRSKVIKELRTCKVPINGSGFRLVARNGLIVTVLKAGGGPKDDA